MKRFLALSCLLSATLASASPHDAQAKAVVEKQLIAKLVSKEEKQSRFSRAYIPPQVRRVRVLDEVAKSDEKGEAFLSFAVDAHHGFGEAAPADDSKDWRKDVITGCVYPDSGDVYVMRKDKLFAAGILWGKKSQPAPEHACVAAGSQPLAAR